MDLSQIMDFQADSPSGWPADRSDPGGLVGAAVPGFMGGTNPSCCSGMVPVLESSGAANPFGSVLNITQHQRFDLMQYYSGEEAVASENSYALAQNLPIFSPRMMQCLPPVFGNFAEGSGLYSVLEQGMLIHHENDHFLTGVDFNLPHHAVQQQEPGVSNSGMEQDRVCFTLESVSKSMSRHLQLFPEARARAPPLQQVRPTLQHVRPTLLQLWRNPTICTRADQKEPHSIAARQRRRRISERLRMLEQLVPGGDRLDTASMLEEACRFVKFLQIQARFLQAIPEAGHPFEFAAPPPDDCPFAIAHELQTVLFKHNLCIASIHHCPPDLLFPHPS